MGTHRAGVLYSLAAFTLWGVLPLYLKLLARVPPLEILLHRVVWSAVFVTLILAVRRNWRWLASLARRPRTLAGAAATASH